MKIIKMTIITLSFLLLSAESCKKDNGEKLPPETQNGNGYFGCLVNGEVWVPNGSPFSIPSTTAGANNKNLRFQANQGPSQSIGFVLKNTDIKSNTIYYLTNDNNSNATFRYTCDKGFYCYYQTSSKFPGQLTITKFDTINKIVSGTFSFKSMFIGSQADDKFCDSTRIDISKGRFDLIYSIL